MIYLFLTGKNNAYLDDVFTALHLPSGVRHCYRYPFRNGSAVVMPNADENQSYEGEPVLTSFWNKEAQAEEQLYIPLRYGRLRNCQLADEQFYYDVILQEYCWAKDVKEYSKRILDISQGKARHKNEEGVLEGYLVLYANEIKDDYTKEEH